MLWLSSQREECLHCKLNAIGLFPCPWGAVVAMRIVVMTAYYREDDPEGNTVSAALLFPPGSSGLVFSHPLHKPGANSSCEPGQATSSATKRCSCCSVHRKEWAGFCTLPFYGEQNGVLHRSFLLFFFEASSHGFVFGYPFLPSFSSQESNGTAPRTCPKDFACPTGTVPKLNITGVVCPSGNCTAQDCCVRNLRYFCGVCGLSILATRFCHTLLCCTFCFVDVCVSLAFCCTSHTHMCVHCHFVYVFFCLPSYAVYQISWHIRHFKCPHDELGDAM